jgi:hypothetical protein
MAVSNVDVDNMVGDLYYGVYDENFHHLSWWMARDQYSIDLELHRRIVSEYETYE